MARVTTEIQVSSLIRRVGAQGGYAAVLFKGDPAAGALLLILCEKGVNHRIYERILTGRDEYSWRKTGPDDAQNSQKMADFLEKRRRFDPDLWVLELDIAQPERFIDELTPLN